MTFDIYTFFGSYNQNLEMTLKKYLKLLSVKVNTQSGLCLSFIY